MIQRTRRLPHEPPSGGAFSPARRMRPRFLHLISVASASLTLVLASAAQPFRLPTANVALFETGGEERFFVGTVGKPWMSGTFGCVRTEGWQMHEGLDIRSVQRDRRGEPTDPVLAVADGTVAYFNSKSGLSNYGKYIILRHQIEGLDIYTLYAHLSAFAPGLKFGDAIKAGAPIATMGRTSNTAQGISRDRAHVHFEIDLVLNERFPDWYRRTYPGQRNDHGAWNGQNLVGLDPWKVLLAQKERGAAFNLTSFIRADTDLCRVAVRVKSFPWLRRYPGLIKPNPVAEREGIAGYEIALNYVGLPFEVIPRAETELKSKGRVTLLSVNAEEYKRRPCRKLVTQRSGKWRLANNGEHLIDLLVF
jgi:murein DD-endopeptidase MepM/ murein hydrolase activator NlpD